MFRHRGAILGELQIFLSMSTNTSFLIQLVCWCIYMFAFVSPWGWHLSSETCRSFLRLGYDLFPIVSICWWIGLTKLALFNVIQMLCNYVICGGQLQDRFSGPHFVGMSSFDAVTAGVAQWGPKVLLYFLFLLWPPVYSSFW
jgi:hypothetical protein